VTTPEGYLARVKAIGRAACESTRAAAAAQPDNEPLRVIAETCAAAYATIEHDDERALLSRPLLTSDNAKTSKGVALGFFTLILYLAPHTSAGIGTQCSHASEACIAGCLFRAGRAAIFQTVNAARVRKTWEFLADPLFFNERLAREISAGQRAASRLGLTLCVRLNGTSDRDWRAVIARFPDVRFYDYTKNPHRRALTPNYDLTFSRSESNETLALASQYRVAVVFDVRKGQPLPAQWNGRAVVDGDVSDLRFLDPVGCIVGLRAKGPAKHDTMGFVVSAQ
jgi:hypothetical protein